MNKIIADIKSTEEHFKILDRWLGFLGVIIVLVMQIAWDFLNRDEITSERQFMVSIYYLICLLTLLLILWFYILRAFVSSILAKVVIPAIYFMSFLAITLGIIPIIQFIDIYVIIGLLFSLSFLIPVYIFEYLIRKNRRKAIRSKD